MSPGTLARTTVHVSSVHTSSVNSAIPSESLSTTATSSPSTLTANLADGHSPIRIWLVDINKATSIRDPMQGTMSPLSSELFHDRLRPLGRPLRRELRERFERSQVLVPSLPYPDPEDLADSTCFTSTPAREAVRRLGDLDRDEVVRPADARPPSHDATPFPGRATTLPPQRASDRQPHSPTPPLPVRLSWRAPYRLV